MTAPDRYRAAPAAAAQQPGLQLMVPLQPAELPAARRALARWARQLTRGWPAVEDLVLATDEVLVNAISNVPSAPACRGQPSRPSAATRGSW